MRDGEPPTDPCRQQLARWAQALAAGRKEELEDALVEGGASAGMAIFLHDNRAKRREKLHTQLEFVAEAVDNFDDLVTAFAREFPLEAYYSTTTDADRFLHWLERAHPLTDEQRDCVACQRARHAVEREARKNRPGHLRFQELWSMADQLAAELDTNPSLTIHLNPIRVWTRLATSAFLDEDTSPPADALFFPVGGDIRTAVLEPAGQALVRELGSGAPCTLEEWTCRSRDGGREELAAFCRDLAEMGLVAFS